MYRRNETVERLVGALAGFDREPRLVKLRHVPQRRPDDRAGRRAGVQRLGKLFSASPVLPAKAASITASSASADASATTANVLQFDAFFAMRIERELADFASRGLPVAADQRHQAHALPAQ